MTSPAGATAFLALWNGISAAASRREYEAWHTFEHVPERVGLPGFVEALRYRSTAAPMSYFTCYWLRDLEAMNSPEYRDVFANPTPWSARMRTRLTDFLRLPCSLEGSHGVATATRLATLHLRAADDDVDGDTRRRLDAMLSRQVADARLVAAQWGRHADTAAIPIANRQGVAAQPGRDLVLMLQALEPGDLQQAVRELQDVPGVESASPPAFFEQLAQVRRAALPASPAGRPRPRMDLFELFAPGDETT